MKQQYKEIALRGSSMRMIELINTIIETYQMQGYVLSVRQLYYQLVARDLIPNTEQSYKRTASIINDGRLAGLIDWDAIEDRNRDIEMRTRWESASSIIDACADSFHMDLWEGQANRVFVIVEKAALAGVVDDARRTGFTETILGRRRYLPDLTSSNRQRREMAERMALNAPIQGSAADIMKIAMVHIAEAFRREGIRSQMILQVHDEVVIDTLRSELDRVREIVEVSKFLATGIAFFEFQPSACDGCQRQSQSLGSDQNVLQPVTGLALCTAPGDFRGGVHKLAGQQG